MTRIPMGTPCSVCGSRDTDLCCVVYGDRLYCLDCGQAARDAAQRAQTAAGAEIAVPDASGQGSPAAALKTASIARETLYNNIGEI